MLEFLILTTEKLTKVILMKQYQQGLLESPSGIEGPLQNFQRHTKLR